MKELSFFPFMDSIKYREAISLEQDEHNWYTVDGFTIGDAIHLVGDIEKFPYAFFGDKELLEIPLKTLEEIPTLLNCYKTADLKIYSTYDPAFLAPTYLLTQTRDGTFREYHLGSFLSYLCGQWGLDLLCFLSEADCSEFLFLPDQYQDLEGSLMGLSQEGFDLHYQLNVHQLLVHGVI